ncbi:MAG: hypothetical protein ACHQJ6_01755 [Candidatus Berkiellales bacterium]
MPEPDDKEKDKATASDRASFKKPKKIKLTPQESGEPAPAVQQQVPPVQQSTAQKLAAAAARELAPEVSKEKKKKKTNWDNLKNDMHDQLMELAKTAPQNESEAWKQILALFLLLLQLLFGGMGAGIKDSIATRKAKKEADKNEGGELSLGSPEPDPAPSDRIIGVNNPEEDPSLPASTFGDPPLAPETMEEAKSRPKEEQGQLATTSIEPEESKTARAGLPTPTSIKPTPKK